MSRSKQLKSFAQNRWAVLAIVIFARAGIGLQFIAIAALIPQLKADLHLNYTQIGLLLGMFMITGVFLSLPSGMIAARLSDRRALQAGLTALVAGAIVLGLSDGFAMALAGRLIGGFGAAFVTVTGAKVLTDRFAGGEIATAMSLLGVTWPVGIALGMSLLPALGAWFSWQTAVLATAAMPVLSLLFVWFLPAPASRARRQATARESAPPLWSIGKREFWLILAGGAAWPLMSSGGYLVFTSYAPGLLLERGASHTAAGLAVALLSWLIIATIPLGGYLADKTGKTDLMFWAGCLVAGAAIALVPVAGPLHLWIVLAAAMGFAVGPIMALPSAVLSPASRGTGLGIYYTLYYLGTGVFPALAGWLQDVTGSVAVVIWFAAACLIAAPFSLLAFRLLENKWLPSGPEKPGRAA